MRGLVLLKGNVRSEWCYGHEEGVGLVGDIVQTVEPKESDPSAFCFPWASTRYLRLDTCNIGLMVARVVNWRSSCNIISPRVPKPEDFHRWRV